MAVDPPDGFDGFVTARSPRLLRTAYLLTRDWALAEGLLQTALARAWEAWRHIDGDPEPYRRRIPEVAGEPAGHPHDRAGAHDRRMVRAPRPAGTVPPGQYRC